VFVFRVVGTTPEATPQFQLLSGYPQKFRRIKGCEQLKDLQKVLHELETTPTLKAA
jgi:hypothetical protein